MAWQKLVDMVEDSDGFSVDKPGNLKNLSEGTQS